MVSGAAAPALRTAPTVLLADADDGSRAMMRDALLEGTGPCDLRAVGDASALHDYLHGHDAMNAPRPALVLIDGDLPHGGGLDAVRAMKSNAALRRIPVVVLARRLDPEAVAAAYDAGANTVIAKPVTFLALVKLIKILTAYWLDAAALPIEHAA
jgi:CheY-like chemotaxis protein